MHCYPWSEEFPPLAPPVVLGPWLKDCLSLRGANAMQGPIILRRGGPNRPALRGDFSADLDPDTRTGIFFQRPGEVGLAIFGWARFRFSCAGMRMQDGRFSATLGTDPLVEDRQLNLPDKSGTLGLEVSRAVPYPNDFTGTLEDVSDFCGFLEVWRRNVSDGDYFVALLRVKGPQDEITLLEDYGDTLWTVSGSPGTDEVDFQVTSGALVMTVGSTAACELGYQKRGVKFFGVDPP